MNNDIKICGRQGLLMITIHPHINLIVLLRLFIDQLILYSVLHDTHCHHITVLAIEWKHDREHKSHFNSERCQLVEPR